MQIKNCYRYLLLLAVLTLIIPLKVNATSYKSDFVKMKDSVEFSSKDFTIAIVDYDYISSGDSSTEIIKTTAIRKTSDIYYFHYIIYCYNSDKVEVGKSYGYNKIEDTAFCYDEECDKNYLSFEIKNKELYDTEQKLSEIEYFKLFIEPVSKTTYDSNIYREKQKLPLIGAEEITDTNIIEMKINPISESSPYILNSYDVNIIVKENNTLNITETIGANFKVNKQGLTKTLSKINEVKRLDDIPLRSYAKIKNIKASDKYSISTEDEDILIKLGDKNKTVKGQKDYTISYTYGLGKDSNKGYDELYFNVINNNWDTSISNITFTITMPKEFDKSKLSFLSGLDILEDTSKISYEISGNTITGRYLDSLNKDEVLIVKLKLEDGYFVNADLDMSLLDYIMFIILISGPGISFLIWLRYGKEREIVETKEVYPTKELNSFEIGYLYNGKVRQKDLKSLLIYLANKGYIKINEIKNSLTVSNKKDYTIIKQKDYDGTNDIEKTFLQDFFTGESSYYNFCYERLDNIFVEKTFKKRIIIAILMTISLFTVLCVPILEYETIDAAVGMIIITGFVYLAAFPFLVIFDIPSIGAKIFVIVHSCTFISVYLICSPIWTVIMNSRIYITAIILQIISMTIMYIFYKKMPRKTPYGAETLGKTLGFKKFIETAQQQELLDLVKENPNYFYETLPYAYVLDLYDVWTEKFETIPMKTPDWYDGSSKFDIKSFNSFITSVMDDKDI